MSIAPLTAGGQKLRVSGGLSQILFFLCLCVSVCAFMSDVNGQRQSKGLWEGCGNEAEVDL